MSVPTDVTSPIPYDVLELIPPGGVVFEIGPDGRGRLMARPELEPEGEPAAGLQPRPVAAGEGEPA